VLEPEDDPELSDPELPPMEPDDPEPVEPLEPVEPVEPLDREPVLPVEEPEDEGLVALPLLLLEPLFFIAASNSERLNRPSASVSAALKSSPGTAAASLESI